MVGLVNQVSSLLFQEVMLKKSQNSYFKMLRALVCLEVSLKRCLCWVNVPVG